MGVVIPIARAFVLRKRRHPTLRGTPVPDYWREARAADEYFKLRRVLCRRCGCSWAQAVHRAWDSTRLECWHCGERDSELTP